MAHEIDFKIYGEEMQYVEIELDPQETAVAESGAFMMMDDGIEMQTMFGDGSKQQNTGFLNTLMNAGKRILTGESLFMTAFTNNGKGKRRVSFAAPYSGRINALDLKQLGGKVIAQKDAFLCAAKGVQVGVEFSKKLGRGLFGGEGFIMQKLEGIATAYHDHICLRNCINCVFICYGNYGMVKIQNCISHHGSIRFIIFLQRSKRNESNAKRRISKKGFYFRQSRFKKAAVSGTGTAE